MSPRYSTEPKAAYALAYRLALQGGLPEHEARRIANEAAEEAAHDPR